MPRLNALKSAAESEPVVAWILIQPEARDEVAAGRRWDELDRQCLAREIAAIEGEVERRLVRPVRRADLEGNRLGRCRGSRRKHESKDRLNEEPPHQRAPIRFTAASAKLASTNLSISGMVPVSVPCAL